jgi:SsrA-binding protein
MTTSKRKLLLSLNLLVLSTTVYESASFTPILETNKRYWLSSRLWSATAIYAAVQKKNDVKKKKRRNDSTIAVNRVAYRNFEIIDTLEAGIALVGTEVKSVRDGKLNLRDGFVKPTKDGRSCILLNVHIGKCSQVGLFYQHEEKRPRNLLVHKEQARKLLQRTDQEGMTIVPLKAYYSDTNKVKLQIALCRGKNLRDKREAIKEREAKRESNRIIKNFRT